MWESKRGKRYWDALTEEEVNPFIDNLLRSGISPAKIIISYNTIFLHWALPSYHGGKSDVFLGNVNEDIAGTDPVAKSAYKPPAITPEPKKEPPKYGWIAPDGRFLRCGYGEHTAKARAIIGEITEVQNPEEHLEDLGWMRVFHNPVPEKGGHYMVGMGRDKKMTNEQAATLLREGLDGAADVEYYL